MARTSNNLQFCTETSTELSFLLTLNGNNNTSWLDSFGGNGGRMGIIQMNSWHKSPSWPGVTRPKCPNRSLHVSWEKWLFFSQCMCAQLCLTLCDPMDCKPPGSSIHGIFQARILGWIATSCSRGSSWPRDFWTQVSWIAGRFFTNWAIREAPQRLSFVVSKGRILNQEWFYLRL